MTFENAKRLGLVIIANQRILFSTELNFTHLFFVPDTADPYQYVNGVLAWGVRGPDSHVQLHYSHNENQGLSAVLVRFDYEKGFAETFDLQAHLQKLGLHSEYDHLIRN